MSHRQDARRLRVVLVWHGEPLEERIFFRPQRITIGPSRQHTFVAPAAQFPDDFAIFLPAPEPGVYLLSLVSGMNGKLSLNRQPIAVADLVSESGRDRVETRLRPSDWGIIGLDEAGDVAIFFQFVAPAALAHGQSWLQRLLQRRPLSLPGVLF